MDRPVIEGCVETRGGAGLVKRELLLLTGRPVLEGWDDPPTEMPERDRLDGETLYFVLLLSDELRDGDEELRGLPVDSLPDDALIDFPLETLDCA